MTLERYAAVIYPVWYKTNVRTVVYHIQGRNFLAKRGGCHGCEGGLGRRHQRGPVVQSPRS